MLVEGDFESPTFACVEEYCRDEGKRDDGPLFLIEEPRADIGSIVLRDQTGEENSGRENEPVACLAEHFSCFSRFEKEKTYEN